MRLASLFLSLALVGGGASAHDLWLEPSGSDYLLLQGHRHSAHAGADRVAYDPSRVRDASCVDAAGRLRPLTPSTAYPVRLPGPCSVLQLRYESGYWTKTPWGTHNQPKSGVAGVLDSWHSEESLKRLEAGAGAVLQPLGRGFELSAQRDPFALAVGDKLVVRVTDDGRPVAGVPVAYAGETRGATGPDGTIAIRLRSAGVQLISATLEQPRNDGKADRSLRTATLQFEVAR